MSTEEQEHEHEPPAEHSQHASSSAVHQHSAMLYAVCLTMVGFMLPLSSYVSLKPFSPWCLAGFYIGIYSVAIVFLVYFVLWVARRPPVSVASINGSETAIDVAPVATTAAIRHRSSHVHSTLMETARQLGVQEIPACSALPQEDSHAPTFFMRIACFLFGSLKVTHDSLMIVDVLTDASGGCASSTSETAGQVIQYLLGIVFTVLQTFFIFKYSKVSVNVCTKISSLGFMHLLATNLCDWFLATFMETSHSAYKSASRGASSYGSSSNSTGCSKDVFWRLAPYLLPFTIEYALMAAVSAYALHENVGKFFAALHLRGTKGSSVLMRCLRKCRGRSLGQSQLSAVNCLRTSRGVIIGALLLIAGIVSGIYFTVYINDKPSDPETSQLIYQATDLGLLIANLVLCVVAYVKMRHLTRMHGAHGSGPDAWLLGITLIGVLGYQLYQLFGSAAEDGLLLGLRVAQCLLAIIQSVFQVFLIFEVEHRQCRSAHAMTAMPGREELAALMLGNISLWIVYTLEIREITSLPTYSDSYPTVATDIITYSCSPLIIFFRFHSACCFVEIWRTAYKAKVMGFQDVGCSHDTMNTIAAAASDDQLELKDGV